MNREENLKKASDPSVFWDIVIIGGGSTGAGCALDAASRGLSVLLLEQHDFGKGTSSRSTKLIHGGVRYLRQGNVSLVRQALKERGLLLRNAPHAIRCQAFVIPCYSYFEEIFYGLGMKFYDRLSGKYGIGSSRILSRKTTLEHLPTLEPEGLRGGVLYYDGQFDDARFLIDLLRTADSQGAAVLNYCKVVSLVKNVDGTIGGVEFIDGESGERSAAKARAVINAAGVFSDPVRHMSDAQATSLLTFSQGTHIVLGRKFLPSDDAVMIPKTSDGRVLFCIPWHEHVLVGTTDTPVDSPLLEPKPSEDEIEFILETAGRYLAFNPTRADILSTFSGIRPLIRSNASSKTSSLSRGHDLFIDSHGLVTITGGKWTTYRRMAEDAVDKAIEIGGLEKVACRTESLVIEPPKNLRLDEKLHDDFPYTRADVVQAVRDEMARTVEDVLARRTRLLFLDTEAAADSSRVVAEIMAEELSRDHEWKERQVLEFLRIASSYQMNSPSKKMDQC